MDAAVQSLKKRKSAGVDNIPAELVQAGGEDVNCRSHDNLQQYLADSRMAIPVDPVPGHHTSQERQTAAVPELPNNKPHQSPKQSHAEDILNILKPQAENIIAEEQEGVPQSRSSTYAFCVRNISSTSKTSACLHRLQEGLRQSLACSFVGNHEEVQHQHKPYSSHQKPV